MNARADARGGKVAPKGGLRLVLDGTPLVAETGGIRRYVEELSLALAEARNGDDVHLLSDQPILASPRLTAAGVLVHGVPPTGWSRRWWLVGLPLACWRMGASVFHGTDFAVPYLHRTPAVITIHDLSPWKDPSWQPQAARIRARTPWMLRLGLADQVITVSNAIRRELLARFPVPAERVHAIPLAAGAPFRPVSFNAAPPPYFLFVGTLEPRKNLPSLIRAWTPVFQQLRVPLKIVGRQRVDFKAPTDVPGLELPGLEWLGTVADEELPALYSGALAVVYPSEYEGFGLPVLEAMQCGAAVIVSRAEALREVAGDAAVVIAENDNEGFTAALWRFATDPAWRREWSVRGLRRAAEFSWAATAAQTRAVYLEAIQRFERKA